ncbi:putative VQ motif-containing protein [Helianthus annuus]|nr:putative VQ motif-containing protein [Helianthus annuus]
MSQSCTGKQISRLPYPNGDTTSFDACHQKTRFSSFPLYLSTTSTPPFYSHFIPFTPKCIQNKPYHYYSHHINFQNNPSMASFDNLAPWNFRSLITDPFYPDTSFARETDSALTLALQQSLFNQPISDNSFLLNPSDYCSPTPSTVTGSGSGSDPETPGSKLHSHSNRLGVTMGKTATKRKSRARSRATTTFIQTDPTNFRRMVQEVTGVKLADGKLPDFTVLKPEPLRQPLVNKLQGLLPTLDTSAYLLDVQNNNTRRIPVSGTFPARSHVTENGGHVTENGGVGVDFYSCSSFPTLESSI